MIKGFTTADGVTHLVPKSTPLTVESRAVHDPCADVDVQISDRLVDRPLSDRLVDRLRGRISDLESALHLVLVGGNHCALLIGAAHPPADASHETARRHYAGRQDAYEAWCCWQTIMMARDVLGNE